DLTAIRTFNLTITAVNDAPSISMPMNYSTIEEDNVLQFDITLSDVEGDSLTVTANSSNTTLVPLSNISLSGTGASRTITITPTANESGNTTITVIAEDPQSLTAISVFNLTVTSINDSPVISAVSSGLASSPISFTITDIDGGSVLVSASSSDASLLTSGGIHIAGTGLNTYSFTSVAGVPSVLTLTLNSVADQHGLVTITLGASISGSITDTESFTMIVGPPGAGNALSFDGTNDYINCGNGNDLDNSGSITIEAWVKPLYKNTISTIVGKKNDGTSNPGYSLFINNWNTDNRKIIFESGNDAGMTTDDSAIEFDKWQHIAVTASGSTATIYVNGVVQSASGSYNTTSNPTKDLFIGSLNSYFHFKGQVDEVRIWNIERTQAQIRTHMCKKLNGNETGLVAYYRMDHTTGLSLADLSNYGHDGSLTNMDNSDWSTSSASLGDDSVYDYVGTVISDFSASIAHADGDQFTATGDGGSYSGIHVYLVNESPNNLPSLTGLTSIDDSHYWGVFPLGTNTTYSIAYNYSDNSYVTDENILRLMSL
ncbi:MAG: hypothetical protein OMM_12662, partial [Candidatus Magnetoglobus multicellularis str. Araruama]